MEYYKESKQKRRRNMLKVKNGHPQAGLSGLDEKLAELKEKEKSRKILSKLVAKQAGLTRKKFISDFFGDAFRLITEKDIRNGNKIFCAWFHTEKSRQLEGVMLRSCICKKNRNRVFVVHAPEVGKIAPHEEVDAHFIKNYTSEEISDFNDERIRFFITFNENK
jgi:hypothetical protein